ncbi:flagellar biosynthesis anti-sigma factor FlgM [Seleniivibrio woodruffii]|uniref:Negative regulator of flagellin synthesis n=1 Tax=Seleniivibrio woodruffii TaxID=1078050 RepID=A0A4R1KFM3_9BACT|nr:flagellar biosynthesis anti-sigma factor FlgM [Seleniivibrio woodruffii]TCK62109.1 FlgM family anti-sigma-28 factor [Seleniivibrio woodruffii]TVZ34774.1 FlgM family anti-sigma-28 factor [Seleniivibrio woodruffii]
MRIDDKMRFDLNKANEATAKKKTASSSYESVSASGTDSVSFSDSARLLSSVKNGVKSSPDVRTDLVADLKNRIENGTYNVSGRQVAEKIVQNSIEDLF